uniref:Uncharacterized protein n=1 Tax=Arion vulgaris TaxID=1028688 RepID=A0A0B7BMY5_9EUPU
MIQRLRHQRLQHQQRQQRQQHKKRVLQPRPSCQIQKMTSKESYINGEVPLETAS